MPLYEYECRKCHHRFEIIEKVGAPEVRKCPKCGSKADRLPASPAIQFKGSGWYVTDYAGKSGSGASSENSDKGAKAEKSEGAEKSDKKDSKSDKSGAKETAKPGKKT